MSFHQFFAFCALTLLLFSCDSHIDDQTIITEEQSKVVNPVPLERDFKNLASGHKVLLALMDSGIDYNHPLLMKNIHFRLDEKGKPSSAGWDFVGNDPWPAPYVARTNYFNENLFDEERAKSLDLYSATALLLEEFTDLQKYFPLERNAEEESEEGVDHGTHVAGLASYDSPEIGLLSYRVLPLNLPQNTREYDEMKAMAQFAEILLKGLKQATQDGARVINMSLGVTLTNDAGEEERAFFNHFQKELISIVDANPEVFFVMAAGNNGLWIDGTSQSVLPCYIPRPNVICVGALTQDMEKADFSNVIMNNEVTTIYAWGDDIYSTRPGNLCAFQNMDYQEIVNGEAARVDFANRAIKECAKDLTFVKMSGTSMASPIIARAIAKIMALHPKASIPQIKSKLFQKVYPSQIGDLKVWKLQLEKPNWYSKIEGNKNKNAKKWEFIVR